MAKKWRRTEEEEERDDRQWAEPLRKSFGLKNEKRKQKVDVSIGERDEMGSRERFGVAKKGIGVGVSILLAGEIVPRE
jgi:hypothetical protein